MQAAPRASCGLPDAFRMLLLFFFYIVCRKACVMLHAGLLWVLLRVLLRVVRVLRPERDRIRRVCMWAWGDGLSSQGTVFLRCCF